MVNKSFLQILEIAKEANLNVQEVCDFQERTYVGRMITGFDKFSDLLAFTQEHGLEIGHFTTSKNSMWDVYFKGKDSEPFNARDVDNTLGDNYYSTTLNDFVTSEVEGIAERIASIDKIEELTKFLYDNYDRQRKNEAVVDNFRSYNENDHIVDNPYVVVNEDGLIEYVVGSEGILDFFDEGSGEYHYIAAFLSTYHDEDNNINNQNNDEDDSND
jgi:hypothetical protein